MMLYEAFDSDVYLRQMLLWPPALKHGYSTISILFSGQSCLQDTERFPEETHTPIIWCLHFYYYFVTYHSIIIVLYSHEMHDRQKQVVRQMTENRESQEPLYWRKTLTAIKAFLWALMSLIIMKWYLNWRIKSFLFKSTWIRNTLQSH